MPASVMPRSWLEGGTAVLDAKGRVLAINEPLSHWLERTQTELIGQAFWEILGTISLNWKESLAQISQGTSEFGRVSLKLVTPESQASQWFTLETARHQETCYVRLNSILPPLAEFEESA